MDNGDFHEKLYADRFPIEYKQIKTVTFFIRREIRFLSNLQNGRPMNSRRRQLASYDTSIIYIYIIIVGLYFELVNVSTVFSEKYFIGATHSRYFLIVPPLELLRYLVLSEIRVALLFIYLSVYSYINTNVTGSFLSKNNGCYCFI